jgi:hypothetical protein
MKFRLWIFVDPLSFERIEDYVSHLKELQLKLIECIKYFPNKYGQLIELVLMYLRCHTMHFSQHFMPVGPLKNMIVSIIPLIHFVVYLLRNMINLFKGNLRSINRPTWWRWRSTKLQRKRSIGEGMWQCWPNW